MARPQPIVIPGKMSTSSYTAPNLLEALQGLTLLAGLYKGTVGEQRKLDTEAAGFKALASQLGLDRTPGTVAENQTQQPVMLAGEPGPGMGQDQGSFLVNLPQPSGMDLEALSKSQLGQKLIQKQYEEKMKPEEIKAISTPEGVVSYGDRGTKPTLTLPITRRPQSDTRELLSPSDNKVHVYGIDEEGNYTRDQGLAKPATQSLSATKEMLNPKDNKVHVYGIDENNNYTRDQGLARPESGMSMDQRNMLRFDSLVGRAQQDPTATQFYKVQGISPRVERAYQDYKKTGNAAVLDDAILYAINKMNDPDSVVMIGEYMRTKELQSLYHAAQGNLMKVYEDTGGLAPKFREEFVNAVRSALKDKEALYDQRMDYYRGRAAKYSSDKEEINAAFPKSADKTSAVSKKEAAAAGEQIAPAGTKARLPNGKVVTSDGKGGWK